MTRSIRLTALWTLTLVACGDTPRRGTGDEAARTAADASPATVPATDGTPAGTTPIEISAVVDGRELSVRGLGECEHAGEGSIYERPASLWAARYDGPDSDPVRHLNLTFWRERSGTESVTMALEVGSEVHRIATVEGGERQGSGMASLEGDAAAGTLVVTGTSDGGTPVTVRAKCSRFTAMVAEGG